MEPFPRPLLKTPPHQGIINIVVRVSIIRSVVLVVPDAAVPADHQVALYGLYQRQGVDLDRAAAPLPETAAVRLPLQVTLKHQHKLHWNTRTGDWC